MSGLVGVETLWAVVAAAADQPFLEFERAHAMRFIQAISFLTSPMTSDRCIAGKKKELGVAIVYASVTPEGRWGVRRGLLKPCAGIGKHALVGAQPCMAAILLAFARLRSSARGVVLTQFGLKTIHPLSGAAISHPGLHAVLPAAVADPADGDTIVWRAVPIFAASAWCFPSS